MSWSRKDASQKPCGLWRVWPWLVIRVFAPRVSWLNVATRSSVVIFAGVVTSMSSERVPWSERFHFAMGDSGECPLFHRL